MAFFASVSGTRTSAGAAGAPHPARTPVGVVADGAPRPVGDDEGVSVRRGLFLLADLGMFVTLGGRWTNDPALPGRPISNVEPHVGIVLGYDILHGSRYALHLGARLAAAYSGGAGRVSDRDVATPEVRRLATTKSSDYAILQVGAELGLALMVAERWALLGKVDTGVGFVGPDPTRVAEDPAAGSAALAPLFGAAIGVEHYTLLNNFSVGLQLRFLGTFLSEPGVGSALIPGLALTLPVKYTF